MALLLGDDLGLCSTFNVLSLESALLPVRFCDNRLGEHGGVSGAVKSRESMILLL